MHQVTKLLQRVQTDTEIDLLLVTIAAMDNQTHLVVTDNQVIQTNEVKALITLKIKLGCRLPVFELQRNDTHANQVATVDTLDALRHHRLDSQ